MSKKAMTLSKKDSSKRESLSSHGGIDFLGLPNSSLTNVRNNEKVERGSSLFQ
jgi:hypothetical protein